MNQNYRNQFSDVAEGSNQLSQFDRIINALKNLFRGRKYQAKDFQYTQQRKQINEFLGGKFQNNTFPLYNSSLKSRIEEYRDYQQMYFYIPEIQRQVRQLISYILKPDQLTDKIFKIDSAQSQQQHDFIEQLITYLEIEDMIYSILFDMLLFGDCFVRIHYKDYENIDLETLQEQYKQQKEKGVQVFPFLEQYQKEKPKKYKIVKQSRRERLTENESIIQLETIFDDDSAEPVPITESLENSSQTLISVPIKLEIIHPEECINLEEYGMHGYLYIPRKVLQKLFSSSQYFEKVDIQQQFSNFEKLISSLQKELKEKFGEKILRQIFIKLDDGESELLFLPYDEVVDFKNQTRYNSCYGQSILEHIKLLATEILLVELSMIIYKLNRQPDRRVFRIPIDNVNPNEVQNYIETIKQKLKNDIQIEINGKIEQLPRIMSILDDYWIPVKNGEGLYEISILEGGNIQHFKDELDYLRNKLLSSLGVPPELINIGGGNQAQTTILQTNEQFQREVVQYQRYVEIQIDNLLFFILNRMNQLEYYKKYLVKLSKPEYFSKLLYYEIQKQKLEYQQQLQQFLQGDTITGEQEYILKNILEFPEEEIDDIKKSKSQRLQQQQQQQQIQKEESEDSYQ